MNIATFCSSRWAGLGCPPPYNAVSQTRVFRHIPCPRHQSIRVPAYLEVEDCRTPWVYNRKVWIVPVNTDGTSVGVYGGTIRPKEPVEVTLEGSDEKYMQEIFHSWKSEPSNRSSPLHTKKTSIQFSRWTDHDLALSSYCLSKPSHFWHYFFEFLALYEYLLSPPPMLEYCLYTYTIETLRSFPSISRMTSCPPPREFWLLS